MVRVVLLCILAMGVSACDKGGSLALEHSEPDSVPGSSSGKPTATYSLGGSSLVIEQGKTKATGYHGWVSFNAVSQQTLSGGGHKVVMDKSPLAQ